MLKDINPGAANTQLNGLVNRNGTLFFSAFDPVNGERQEIAEFTPDTTGVRRIDPPTTGHDWVLILEPRK